MGRATIGEAHECGIDPVAEAVKAVDGWLLFGAEITPTHITDERS
ncbi:MAG TPA: hypothetical protein VMW58_04640 [Anaerolineae bacterium]|nr:hypothetical protein [Anaerolineae bacterium]